MDNPFDSEEGRQAIARRLEGVNEATILDYISDVWARAVGIAPCIARADWPKLGEEIKADELKAILRSIILRWHEAQSGGITGKSQMAGPYQQSFQLDTRPKRGYTLQPSEIVDLQRLCMRQGRPFSFSTMPAENKVLVPLKGVVVNGHTETLDGPPGEWSPDAPVLDI